MRQMLIVAALMSAASISTVAQAQTAVGGAGAPPVKVQSGERVYSADGAVVGRVEYLDKSKDGALTGVAVVTDMRMVHIPAATLSNSDKGVQTSLKRADLAKLN